MNDRIEENPFAPSQVDYARGTDMPRKDFVDMDTKEVRRLCTVAGVTRMFWWLWGLMFILISLEIILLPIVSLVDPESIDISLLIVIPILVVLWILLFLCGN